MEDGGQEDGPCFGQRHSKYSRQRIMQLLAVERRPRKVTRRVLIPKSFILATGRLASALTFWKGSQESYLH